MKNDSVGWTFYAKSHKKDSLGNTPILEYHVTEGDSLALRKFVNPRLIIVTGD